MNHDPYFTGGVQDQTITENLGWHQWSIIAFDPDGDALTFSDISTSYDSDYTGEIVSSDEDSIVYKFKRIGDIDKDTDYVLSLIHI